MESIDIDCGNIPLENLILRNRYQLVKHLGEGYYGQVSKYYDLKNKEMVAIKSPKDPRLGFKDEFSILRELRECNPDRVNIITFKRLFSTKLKICFVFECLEQNMDQFAKDKYLPLSQIRAVGVQLATALQTLKDRRIVHGDISPSNIMVMGFENGVVRVKLIDFGCSFRCHGKDIKCYIASYGYQCPEVILGLPSDEGVDMWSLGCVLAELLIGKPLYRTAESEAEMLNFFCESLDAETFPECFRQGIRFGNFFEMSPSRTSYIVKDPTPDGHQSPLPGGLNDLLGYNLPELDELDRGAEMCDRKVFIDFLKEVLCMDPEKRANPSHILTHAFLTACHLHKFECSIHEQSQEVQSDVPDSVFHQDPETDRPKGEVTREDAKLDFLGPGTNEVDAALFKTKFTYLK